MFTGASFGAGNEGSAGGTDHQAARLREEFAAGGCLEIVPQLVRTLHERNVKRMFEVGFANDSRRAMRRTQ